jgi:hypothetical protein
MTTTISRETQAAFHAAATTREEHVTWTRNNGVRLALGYISPHHPYTRPNPERALFELKRSVVTQAKLSGILGVKL